MCGCHLVSIHGLTDNRSLRGRQAEAPHRAILGRFVHHAALHHEHDAAHGLDVGGRIARDGDEVRVGVEYVSIDAGLRTTR